MVNVHAREVSLAQVSWINVYVNVVLPMIMGACQCTYVMATEYYCHNDN